jgi:hypothetical protein
MAPRGTISERLARLKTAFERDGFDVGGFPQRGGYVEKDGKFGLVVPHKTAVNAKSGKPKKAFYIEGDSAAMGYFMGRLAEPDVKLMAVDYVDHVILSFLNIKTPPTGGVLNSIQELLVKMMRTLALEMRRSIPPEYVEELEGVLKGCTEANPNTEVTYAGLWALNFGVDCALAHLYSGKLFSETEGVDPRNFRTPIACNGYALSGEAAGGKVYFGRDFMFPTADIFQLTACMVIQNPEPGPDGPRRAFVSQTAPGFIGSMTAMNAEGVAAGVDMLPTALCNPEKPGFNSLVLVRDCVQYSSTSEEAVERIARAERGVTWIYPIADAHGASFMVEAGRALGPHEHFPYFDYVPRHYRRRLPSRRYMRAMRRAYGTPAPDRGIVARPGNYNFPVEYLRDWNRKLWGAWNRGWGRRVLDFILDLAGLVVDFVKGRRGLWKRFKAEIEELIGGAVYSDDYFGERAYINTDWKKENCPSTFYFAPQRESRDDLSVATNHCITPEMRLTEMNEWIALLTAGNQNDVQWRYDELNKRILDAIDLAGPGGIDADKAWNLINFLTPKEDLHEYYNPGGTTPLKEIQVHGSVSLCELTGRTIKSLFGYYADEPVVMHLMDYLG